MVTNFSDNHSIVSVWVRELRDSTIHGDSMRFRKNLERTGEVAAYELSKHLNYKNINIQTPLCETAGTMLETQPVIATIMRAGLPLFQGLLNFFDQADCAFIGSYRKHNQEGAFAIEQQYQANPPLTGRPLIIADPMLATGSSMIKALESLMENDRPSQLHIVSVIASSSGIANIVLAFPEAFIWTAAIDKDLNSNSYIVPGLGDAGDLAFGKKRQF